MKTTVLFILCLMLYGIAFGQKKNIDEVKVTPPKFIGVTNAISVIKDGKAESIDDYLARNIEYPEKDRKSFNQGTEVVQFTVTPNGELKEYIIINSVSPLIDDEVIRALETTNGMWIPGYNNDEPFVMETEVSVVFKVNGNRFDQDFLTLGTKHFTKGSEMLLTQNNPKKAMKSYDKGIKLLPNDESLLLMRGFARYGAGNFDGAMRDWERIIYLGGTFSDEYLTNLSGLEGYAELLNVLKKNPETDDLLITKQ